MVMPANQTIGSSGQRSLDRLLKGALPMPYRGEPRGADAVRKIDSPHNTIRYAICRVANIDSADWGRFFSHLAPSDIRYRFGRLVSGDAGLRLVTLPNQHGSAIFAAFCSERLVGVSNLAKDDRGGAEIAVLVRSDWKRRGIGKALMRAALGQATLEGLQVYGLIQPSNDAIIGLMRRCGFVHGSRQIDHTTMHWHPAGRPGSPSEAVGQQAGSNKTSHWARATESVLPAATV